MKIEYWSSSQLPSKTSCYVTRSVLCDFSTWRQFHQYLKPKAIPKLVFQSKDPSKPTQFLLIVIVKYILIQDLHSVDRYRKQVVQFCLKSSLPGLMTIRNLISRPNKHTRTRGHKYLVTGARPCFPTKPQRRGIRTHTTPSLVSACTAFTYIIKNDLGSSYFDANSPQLKH